VLPWVVLPLAAAAGFYGVGGLYEARRSRRADPTWYASAGLIAALSAGLIAALSAVSANIIVGGA
jgi:hypothetical protein